MNLFRLFTVQKHNLSNFAENIGEEYLSEEYDEGLADGLVSVHGGDVLEHGAAGRAGVLL